MNENLAGNLRKAPKLTFKATHLGRTKQNVSLALAICQETSAAMSRRNCQARLETLGKYRQLSGDRFLINLREVRFVMLDPFCQIFVFMTSQRGSQFENFLKWISKMDSTS